MSDLVKQAEDGFLSGMTISMMRSRIDQLERELAAHRLATKHANDHADAAITELAAEKALADRLDETLKKADDALHDDGCRPTMWPRPQIADARSAYRKARGLL